MNRDDVVDLLTQVSVSDNRTLGDIDVSVWQEVLGTMYLDDCLKALVEFRRESPGVWLEPGHIVRLVRGYEQARWEAEQLTAEEQRRLAQHQYREQRLAGLTAAERERAIITSDGEVCVPASPEHRAKCMAEIRAILAKPGRQFGLSPEAVY